MIIIIKILTAIGIIAEAHNQLDSCLLSRLFSFLVAFCLAFLARLSSAFGCVLASGFVCDTGGFVCGCVFAKLLVGAGLNVLNFVGSLV